MNMMSLVLNAKQKGTALTIVTVRYVVKLFLCLQDFADSEMERNKTDQPAILECYNNAMISDIQDESRLTTLHRGFI